MTVISIQPRGSLNQLLVLVQVFHQKGTDQKAQLVE